MIKYDDVLSVQYLGKQAFTGSYQGMRYRLCADKSGDEPKLLCFIWPEPLCFEATNQDSVDMYSFSFDEEGRRAAIDKLNEVAPGYASYAGKI